MEVRTKVLGTVSIDEEQKLTIPQGLFGFEQYTEYALLPSGYDPFFWLQSLEDEGLAFLVVDPFLLRSDYEADVDDASLSAIGVSSPSEVIVMVVVTLPRDGGDITMNLQGPLVINNRNGMCAQVILSDPRWKTKQPIILPSEEKRGVTC